MIANYSEKGWEIITQRAHGIVAAQIGMHWKSTQRPERWIETLMAIAEHDDAEVELDGENLLTPAGGPLNFSMKSFELENCERLSMLTITKSRYIALLTSMHMDFLYRKEEKENKTVAKFLADQRLLQKKWLKELKLSKEEASFIYSFIEWCDACSLLICQRQLQPEQRSLEISNGPDGTLYKLYQLSENELTVTPWPFEIPSFSVNFESRMISQLQFKNSAELRNAFLEAPVEQNSWKLVNQKPAEQKKKKKV